MKARASDCAVSHSTNLAEPTRDICTKEMTKRATGMDIKNQPKAEIP